MKTYKYKKLKNCVCTYCGLFYRKTPSLITNNNYCSWGCFSLSQKNKVCSDETRQKMSVSQLGHRNKLGKKATEETKRKLSESLKGRPAWNKGLKGFQAGENHPRWIQDRTKLQKYNDTNKDRRSSAYRYWRMQVWVRDNFKCKINNQDCDGPIEAHHILGWTKYVELRYEVNNGITLCHAHHPRKRAEEKRLIPVFQGLMSVSKV